MNKRSDKVLDEWLVLRAQDGDRRSLALLVNRWHKKLVAYAFRKTNDMEAAKDLVQDSWQAIVKQMYLLQNPSKFRVWAHRIVNNKSVSWIREKQRERRMNHEIEEEQLGKASAEMDFGPIRRAVQQLPDKERTILILFYQNDYTIKEIAEILGINEGTVKSRLFYARKKVKEFYSQQIN
ncbi:MAG: RNA polymerase sigma factor [Cyclobacteriaceae bacterium]|nr:RNA polymerase sigma factor [Cyclobacteriaceae bacterium]